jgi:hypothetical protein
MCTLHGVTWLHVEHTPTCDFAKSARVKPTACNIARPGARSGPSNTSDECGLLLTPEFYRFHMFQGSRSSKMVSFSDSVPEFEPGTPTEQNLWNRWNLWNDWNRGKRQARSMA